MRRASTLLVLLSCLTACGLHRDAAEPNGAPAVETRAKRASGPRPATPAAEPPPPPDARKAATVDSSPAKDLDARSEKKIPDSDRRPAAKAHAMDKTKRGTFESFGAGSGAGLASMSESAGRAAVMPKMASMGIGQPLDEEAAPPPRAGGTFVHHGTNHMTSTTSDRLSTFAIDVDTGSYSYAMPYLRAQSLPPAASVRVEEWVNSFKYDYADPTGDAPFAVHMDGAPSPFTPGRHVLRVGIQGKRIDKRAREPVHLTFLVDVSGSMSPDARLGLAKRSLHLLVEELDERDTVGLVTYAGNTSVALETTGASNKKRIHDAIDALRSGGGTAMGSGMELAYTQAVRALENKGASRVVVLSDGDANIGRTSSSEILRAVKSHVSEGVTMSTVGFGNGNYNDHLMEQLADAGNGNYSYIDSMETARRVFVDDVVSTLQVIAKDVKIQVEMNPAAVKSYRLLGYENRDVADAAFRDDRVDAGEIGAGHAVTALYEVELVGDEVPRGELATVRVRYKAPRGDKASEVTHAFLSSSMRSDPSQLGADTKLAVAVALGAELSRGSPYVQHLSFADVRALAAASVQGPHAPERRAFADLVMPLAARGSVATR